MKYSKITPAVAAALAAVTLAGCSTGPGEGSAAAPSSSAVSNPYGGPRHQDADGYGNGHGIPIADIGHVSGHCQQLVTFGGDTWVLPRTGVGQLVWAPSAKHSGCVILPGQVPVAITPAAGAPASVPTADYVVVGGRCTGIVKTPLGTVWAVPDSGLGELTRVTEPVTVACRKAVN